MQKGIIMAHANFQVATKALIVHNNKILALINPSGRIDFPGGRLNDTEYETSFEECLQRELSEELGKELSYQLLGFVFAARRSYEDKGMHHIVTLFFNVNFIGGEIIISDEHQEYLWISQKELLKQKENFVSDSEYQELKQYLERA